MDGTDQFVLVDAKRRRRRLVVVVVGGLLTAGTIWAARHRELIAHKLEPAPQRYDAAHAKQFDH